MHPAGLLHRLTLTRVESRNVNGSVPTYFLIQATDRARHRVFTPFGRVSGVSAFPRLGTWLDELPAIVRVAFRLGSGIPMRCRVVTRAEWFTLS